MNTSRLSFIFAGLALVSFAFAGLTGCAAPTEGDEDPSESASTDVQVEVQDGEVGTRYIPRITYMDLAGAGARCIGTYCTLGGRGYDCKGAGYCSVVSQ